MSFVTYCAGPATAAALPRAARTSASLDRLLENLTEQGVYALNHLQSDHQRDTREVRALLDAGLLAADEHGNLKLTPRALLACEERLLIDLLRTGGGGYTSGKHQEGLSPSFSEPGDEPRAYRPGEPLGGVDVTATLRQTLRRGLPPQLHEEDLVVLPALTSGRCATVLLLDLSGSMARHGKFGAARRAALALRGLVRRRFHGDELFTAGFASLAEPLPGTALLEARPREVGLFDPGQSTLRLPVGSSNVPGHFTNIQDGLRLARKHLRGRANLGKQAFLITDGDPTAHLDGGDVVLCFPPTEETRQQTLREAARCAREGIVVHVFGLVGEFSPPGLDVFVEQLARHGGGKAVCCSPRQLGSRIVTAFTRSRSNHGRSEE